MSQTSLRAANEDDLETVFAMLRALAEAVGETEEFTANLDDVRRDAFGPKPRYETIMAEIDGRPAGLMTLFPTYSTYKGRPCLYVNDIYVEPWARGLRVGRALMARVCHLAAARGCCRVELKVLDDNPAQRFYEYLGMGASREVAYTIHEDALHALAEEDSPH